MCAVDNEMAQEAVPVEYEPQQRNSPPVHAIYWYENDLVSPAPPTTNTNNRRCNFPPANSVHFSGQVHQALQEKAVQKMVSSQLILKVVLPRSDCRLCSDKELAAGSRDPLLQLHDAHDVSVEERQPRLANLQRVRPLPEASQPAEADEHEEGRGAEQEEETSVDREEEEQKISGQR